VKSQENQPKGEIIMKLQKKIKLKFMLWNNMCPSCLLQPLFILSFSSRN